MQSVIGGHVSLVRFVHRNMLSASHLIEFQWQQSSFRIFLFFHTISFTLCSFTVSTALVSRVFSSTCLIECYSVLLAQLVFDIVTFLLTFDHGVSGLDLAVQPGHPSLTARSISVANSPTSTSTSWPRTRTSISGPSASSHPVCGFYMGTPWHATYTTAFPIHAVTFDLATEPLAFSEHFSTTTFHVSTTTTTICASIATSYADNNTEVPKYTFAPTDQITNQDGVSTSCH